MIEPVQRPHGTASLLQARTSLSSVGPARLEYRPTERTGLARLPPSILDQLRSAGSISQPNLVEWVDESRTRRRRDGTYYQQLSGWWATVRQLNLVTVRRQLGPAGGGRLRPCGPWVAGGTSYVLPNGLSPERTTWRFRAPEGPPVPLTGANSDQPLDLLPPHLAALLAGGEAQAILSCSRRVVEEEVLAYRLVDHRVRILHGARSARTRDDLAVSDWMVQSLDAPVVGTAEIATSGWRSIEPASHPGRLDRF
ncbi:MAG: hypothetical protein ACYCVN_09330 [Acidimicrobiales bacterium]